jgi:uncharacterized MnhB-related membrane protein
VIATYVLLALLPIVAVIALTQSRRLSAIIGMGLFSFLLAAAYLLMHAPDVAITEATIGAALVTAIYVLAIRRTGRLSVVADEAPGLMAREGDQVVGLEYDILHGFAQAQGLDLSVRFVPLRRVRWLIAHHEADIGAGGIIPLSDAIEALHVTPGYLETGVYAFEPDALQHSPDLAPDYEGYFSELRPKAHDGLLPSTAASLDLARVLALSRGAPLQGLDRLAGPHSYAFLVSDDRVDLNEDLARYIASLRDSGELARLIERHVQ